MVDGNLFTLLQSRWAGGRDRAFLLTAERTWCYGELDALSAAYAASLRQAGVGPGDRVAVQVEKSAHAVALYLAVLRRGAVFVPLNPAYTPAEVRSFLADAEPRLFVCRPEDEAACAAAAPAGAEARTLGTDGAGSFALRESADHAVVPRGENDLASILYTSGTTGRSKGAMVTHGNLASNALTLSSYWKWRSDDVLLHALPIFHIHGLFVGLHLPMLAAAPILFLPKFDVRAVRALLPRATVMMGVPTFYTRLLGEADFGARECAHMRLFISGSAPLHPATHREFRARTGHAILERYGMSEAGMIASNPLEGERIAGTVGYPLPGISVRVRGEGGKLAVGAPGTIEVKGPNVFKGYWRMPERLAEDFTPDGYFITGDLGVQAPDGRLTIVGRAKDLIITGGYNVYPKEIETVLDSVAGILESAVIGVPHPDFGEGVVAVVATADGAPPDMTAVRAALDRELARFKHPKAIFAVRDLPRNAMGKVQKKILRETYCDAFAPARRRAGGAEA